LKPDLPACVRGFQNHLRKIAGFTRLRAQLNYAVGEFYLQNGSVVVVLLAKEIER
jgi:hypothetical protein